MVRMRRPKAAAVAATLAGAMLGGAALIGQAGIAAGAVAAGPQNAKEAILLAAMKSQWQSQSARQHSITCRGYRLAPGEMISRTLDVTMADDQSAAALNRAAWRRVITGYLDWACAGPGTTPR